ncbi:MAG: HNH endonuclease signature motif containing protein [Micrococcaceae bacterium]
MTDTTTGPIRPPHPFEETENHFDERLSAAGDSQRSTREEEIHAAQEFTTSLGLDTLSLEQKAVVLVALSAELSQRLLTAPAADIYTHLNLMEAAPDGDHDWSTLWAASLQEPEHTSIESAEKGVRHAPESDSLGTTKPLGVADSPSSANVTAWLPALLQRTSTAGQLLESALTSMSSTVDQVFDHSMDRYQLLGVPAGRRSFRDSTAYMRDLTGRTRSQIRAWTDVAEKVCPGPSEPSGHRRPARYTHLAASVQDGTLHVDNATMVLKAMRNVENYARQCKVDAQSAESALNDGERMLANRSRTLHADGLRKLCDQWEISTKNHLDQDGVPPTTDRPSEKQGLTYKGYNAQDDLYQWGLRLTQIQHELLLAATSAATNPRSHHAQKRAQALSSLFEEFADEQGLDPTDLPPTEPSASASGQDLAAEPADAIGRPEPASQQITTTDTNDVDAETDDRPGQHPLPLPDLTDPAESVSFDPLDDQHLPEMGHVTDATAVRMSRRVREALQLEAIFTALHHGISALSGTPTLPRSNGVLPRLTVLMDYATLHQSLTGFPDSPRGAPNLDTEAPPVSTAMFSGHINPRNIRHLACDAEIIPVVMDGKNAVLDQGRHLRNATEAQRTALLARDRGCAAPGCTMTAAWCQPHHVIPWVDGGATNLNNLVLLCPGCHRATHDGRWSIEITDGTPWFTPASYVDLNQTPRRNDLWHTNG